MVGSASSDGSNIFHEVCVEERCGLQRRRPCIGPLGAEP
jgi:hypothetical protein